MDTTRDDIIGNPLATKKKVGRKSLGLTPEEMKAHREVLRKNRVQAKRFEKRKADTVRLVDFVLTLGRTRGMQEIVDELLYNKRWTIDYNPNALYVSGVTGKTGLQKPLLGVDSMQKD